MIEIIAGVWLTCFCLSMITVAVNYYLLRKKLHSRKLKNINANLEKAGMYWSNSAGDFLALTSDSIQTDAAKTLRNSLFLAGLGFASVPGFLLLAVIVFSMHVLVRSRKEIATFRSRLSEDSNLSKSEVENLVKEFGQIF